ncbi:MAG: BglII/BstYI family type II restriction endonuclease [Bacteroidota bacterium]
MEEWLNQNRARLFIGRQYFHHHALEILNAHSVLKNTFCDALNGDIPIAPRLKSTKGIESKGIKAEELNVALRTLLRNRINTDIKFEVVEEYGVFYFSSEKSSIGGFDFALLNHQKNLLALRNLCYGELVYNDGIKRWNTFLAKNEDLRKIATGLVKDDEIGKNISLETDLLNMPLVVGEIQFGNWALAYRDFFKVLKANVQNSIDCLIYIVPTGNLESLLSDGIVTFEKTERILKEFSKVISVPVWLVGIDIDEGN